MLLRVRSQKGNKANKKNTTKVTQTKTNRLIGQLPVVKYKTTVMTSKEEPIEMAVSFVKTR